MEKKILFDLTSVQPIGNIKFHGGGKYGIAVFKNLIRMNSSALAAYLDDQAFLDESVIQLIEQYKIPVYKKREIDVYAVVKCGGVLYTPMFNANNTPLPPSGITLITT